MARRISQLTALTSASLDTTLLGVDRGVSYKIELDVLADAVKDRINTLDDIRLDSLESFTASYSVTNIPAGTISGSSQLTSSFDQRYTLSASIKTDSFAITGSNEFIGNQTINGSLTTTEFIQTSVIQATGSLYLQPDSTDNRHFEIYNTSPTDVHIKSNGGLSYFGDDTNYLKIDDSSGDVTIAAFSDIILTADDGGVYIGSYGSGNGVVTNGYLNTIIGDTDIINGATGNSITDVIGRIPTIDTGSLATTSSLQALIDATGSFLTSLSGAISSSAQITAFGFISSSQTINTGSFATTGSNSFNGNQTITGSVTTTGVLNVGTVGSGDEGGEIQLAVPQTNTSLTNKVIIDVFQNRLRFWEAGADSKGVYVDLSKTPAGNAGELLWKASGMVAAGTFVTLDNLKCTVTTSSNRGLSIGAVSTKFEADLSGWYAASIGSAGGSTNNISYTTTASSSLFNWNFIAHGDTAHYHIRDKTNNRFYRVTMMIGIGYNSNFISIERLF